VGVQLMAAGHRVAVVGATGVVGEAMLEILAESTLPLAEVFALASERSAGETVHCGGAELRVGELAKFDFSRADIVLSSAGATVSAEFAPRAVGAGCVVIDNSSQFRYDREIPLVVPEVNPHAVAGHRGIIANPNCSTIQLVVALKPLHDAAGLARVNVCTYQSVSGAGRRAVTELAEQSAALLNGRPAQTSGGAKQAAFNAVPHIDVFQDNGYTREEMKSVWETRKILEDETIRINATAVRVPVFYGHSEAVHLETRGKLSAAEALEILAGAPGVTIIDEHKPGGYPTAATDAANRNEVFVGRVREDISHPRGLNLWVVSDNVRKGAALNSVQIAEVLAGEGMGLRKSA